ncbi:MAG: hypothetical protein HQ564_04120 [Candidatus Saganbacteria bacterium]|nr:hypothetical protein [Candidatus Saganbacteria bacterium]
MLKVSTVSTLYIGNSVKPLNIRAKLKNTALSLQGRISDFATSKYAPLIELAIMNPPLVIPMLQAIVINKVPIVFGICNLAHIIAENLGNIIAGIKGRNDELIREFQGQIDQIKSTINSFLDTLITDLRSEMGIDAIDYELDQHKISHAFEDWMRDANLMDLGNPKELAELKELLKERIGLDAEDDDLIKILENKLASADITEDLAAQVASLKLEMEEYIKDHPEETNDSDDDADNDDFTPTGVPKGRTQNA